MVSDFRQAVMQVISSFKLAEDSAELLVKCVDDSGVSVVTPNKVPILNLNQCPYLELRPVKLASSDAIGQYEVQLTIEISLWVKGWELTVGDRFLTLLATLGLRTWRRPPYNYRVELSGESPERKFQVDQEGNNGQPVTETRAILQTKVCSTS
jgi:hypothetical protein